MTATAGMTLWVGSLGVALREEVQVLARHYERVSTISLTAVDPSGFSKLWSYWSQRPEGLLANIDTAQGSLQLGRHVGCNIHLDHSPSLSSSLPSGKVGFHFLALPEVRCDQFTSDQFWPTSREHSITCERPSRMVLLLCHKHWQCFR